MKRFLSLMLALTVVLTLSAVFSPATSAAAESAIGYSAENVTPKENLDALPDIQSGISDGVTEYKITNAAGIEKTAHIANGTNGETRNNFAGITLYLANDIDMTGVAHEPIGLSVSGGVIGADVGGGDQSIKFAGVFDGQGFAIKNLIAAPETGNYRQFGLFGNVIGGTVRNLVIDHSCRITLGSAFAVSFVAAYSYWSAIFENISVRGVMDGVGATYAGGVLARGHGGGNLLFTNCENFGAMRNMTVDHLGGIGGSFGWNGSANLARFTACRNAADISGSGHCGGIIGAIQNCPIVALKQCVNNGKISTTANAQCAGGLVGSIGNAALKLSFESCSSYGAVNKGNPFFGMVATTIGTDGYVSVDGTVYQNLAQYSGGKNCGAFSTGTDAGYVTALLERLGLQAQVLKGTTDGSDHTELRLIGAIDALEPYNRIGFRISFTLADGTELGAQEKLFTTVYSSILVNDGEVAATDPESVFGAKAAYFSAYTVTDIPQEHFGMTVHVSPLVEVGGTVYAGAETTFRLNTLWNH